MKKIIVTDNSTLLEFTNKLHKQEFITIDTEFARNKTFYPKLCLIQIATQNEAAIVDVRSFDHDISLIRDILKNEYVTKVLHGARQDLEIFANLYQVEVKNLFDTQIAATFLNLGSSIGYENLAQILLGVKIDKSCKISNWENRPLTNDQINYAFADVTYLVDIFIKLRDALNKLDRYEWVVEDSKRILDGFYHSINPEHAWQRVKGINAINDDKLKVLYAVSKWREEVALLEDLPRGYILGDDEISKMVKYGIKASNIDDETNNTWQLYIDNMDVLMLENMRDSFIQLVPKNERLFFGLQILLKVKAQMHNLNKNQVADNKSIIKFINDNDLDVPFMNGWRYEIFGKDAKLFSEGKMSIRIDNKEYKITYED